MEHTLRRLFDYQRFQPCPRLTRLMDETLGRYGRELDDDALELVSAAGDPGLSGRRPLGDEDADEGK